MSVLIMSLLSLISLKIYGVKEANIERKTTSHLPAGVEVLPGQIVSQTRKLNQASILRRLALS